MPYAYIDRMKPVNNLLTSRWVHVVCLVGILVFYKIFKLHVIQVRVQDRSSTWLKPIPVLSTRDELGTLLENEGMKTGVEIGVQRGLFSEKMLSEWKGCEKYYLVDVWKQQESYFDIANVGEEEQEQIYLDARNRMTQWKAKTVFLRMYSTEAVDKLDDEEVDFIYVDARHDYCGVRQDIEMYWPKLREGGIMAGHDYVTAQEVDVFSNGSQDWSTCGDGTKHMGAVKGAVNDFAEEHQLQVLVTYREQWPTWIIRKPLGIKQSTLNSQV